MPLLQVVSKLCKELTQVFIPNNNFLVRFVCFASNVLGKFVMIMSSRQTLLCCHRSEDLFRILKGLARISLVLPVCAHSDTQCVELKELHYGKMKLFQYRTLP